MNSSYPKDEFDYAGEDMPIGMHRPRPSRWKHVWPFFLILLIVPALGWGLSHLLSNQGQSLVAPEQSGATTTQTQPETPAVQTPQSEPAVEKPVETPAEEPVQESEVAQSTPTETPESAPADSAPAAGEVKKDVLIQVLNGSGKSGLARDKAKVLQGAGFGKVEADNAQNWASQVSAVYFHSAELEATAKEVAKTLGISEVKAADVGNGKVVVLLRKDQQ